MVHFYELASLQPEQRRRLLRRSEVAIDDLLDYVRPLLKQVREQGDAGLLELIERFDKVRLTPQSLRVSKEEIARAYEQLDPEVLAAIKQAVRNVETFHQKQMPHEQWWTEIAPGVLAGEKITPITSVGLYVPRGKGAFPSVMYMLAVPARIAGVPRIVVSTPPAPDGSIDAASLVAADLCGVHEIYKMGGAQAIAALAYGTESIQRVHKITGPGNPYVSAAKRLLFGTVDVGLPAGPSELLILADDSADAELVARDLLIEAEHGPDSSSVLVTDSAHLAKAVRELLPAKIEALPEPRKSFVTANFLNEGGTSAIVLTSTFQQALDFTNDYAAEHLEVHVREPLVTLASIKNAGEILLGPYAPTSMGNYALGTNAILPTGGFAHTYSCTSVFDFLKRTGLGYITREGYDQLSGVVRTLANFEGFPAHANAVTDRPDPEK